MTDSVQSSNLYQADSAGPTTISDNGDSRETPRTKKTGRENFMNVDLFKATKNGNLQLFKATLDQLQGERSTILAQTTSHKNTFLHVASSFGHEQLAEFLIGDFPFLIELRNCKGDTALHVAARAGHLAVVDVFFRLQRDLESNINLPTVVNELHNTALHVAMIRNHGPVVDFLLGQIGKHKELVLYLNKDWKSPLYLAIEAGNVENVAVMLRNLPAIDSNSSVLNKHRTGGKSVLQAAIMRKDLDLLTDLAKKGTVLFKPRHNPLHCAASVGFVEGVTYLLTKFSEDTFKIDKRGFLPIHHASKNGHINVIKALLDYYSYAREFLTRDGGNILHVAAEYGQVGVVDYLLKCEEAESLMNEKDKKGNTPLHLATKNGHPKVVTSFTWDSRVNLKIVNNKGMTALEVAEEMEVMPPFRKRLTWMALMSAGAPRARVKDAATVKRLKAAKYEPYNMEYCKDRVNTLLLVAALVATVTFAAGFTMPGGNDNNSNSKSNQGMATMVHNSLFQVFVICDSLALYSSIIVVVTLMWAQLGDLNLLLNSLRSAQRLLGFCLTMMALAFLAGVNVVVTELDWLADVSLAMGIISLATLLALFVPLFLPYISHALVARYISYYPFKLLMIASES